MVVDATEKARTCLAAVDAAVSDQDFLVVNLFSAADIMMGYSLMLARRWGRLLDDTYPEVLRYRSALLSATKRYVLQAQGSLSRDQSVSPCGVGLLFPSRSGSLSLPPELVAFCRGSGRPSGILIMKPS